VSIKAGLQPSPQETAQSSSAGPSRPHTSHTEPFVSDESSSDPTAQPQSEGEGETSLYQVTTTPQVAVDWPMYEEDVDIDMQDSDSATLDLSDQIYKTKRWNIGTGKFTEVYRGEWRTLSSPKHVCFSFIEAHSFP